MNPVLKKLQLFGADELAGREGKGEAGSSAKRTNRLQQVRSRGTFFFFFDFLGFVCRANLKQK